MDLTPEQIHQLVVARIRQIYWQALGRFPTEQEVAAMLAEGHWQGKPLPVVDGRGCVKEKG
jgi:hypothetical protein